MSLAKHRFVAIKFLIASKKLISKLFSQHLSGDKCQNIGKNSIDCLIKLNKDM